MFQHFALVGRIPICSRAIVAIFLCFTISLFAIRTKLSVKHFPQSYNTLPKSLCISLGGFSSSLIKFTGHLGPSTTIVTGLNKLHALRTLITSTSSIPHVAFHEPPCPTTLNLLFNFFRTGVILEVLLSLSTGYQVSLTVFRSQNASVSLPSSARQESLLSNALHWSEFEQSSLMFLGSKCLCLLLCYMLQLNSFLILYTWPWDCGLTQVGFAHWNFEKSKRLAISVCIVLRIFFRWYRWYTINLHNQSLEWLSNIAFNTSLNCHMLSTNFPTPHDFHLALHLSSDRDCLKSGHIICSLAVPAWSVGLFTSPINWKMNVNVIYIIWYSFSTRMSFWTHVFEQSILLKWYKALGKVHIQSRALLYFFFMECSLTHSHSTKFSTGKGGFGWLPGPVYFFNLLQNDNCKTTGSSPNIPGIPNSSIPKIPNESIANRKERAPLSPSPFLIMWLPILDHDWVDSGSSNLQDAFT